MRIIFFILLILTALFSHWVFFIALSLVYAFRYPALELLGLGFFLDAIFGNPMPGVPVTAIYTLSFFVILLVLQGVKPLLSLYLSRQTYPQF